MCPRRQWVVAERLPLLWPLRLWASQGRDLRSGAEILDFLYSSLLRPRRLNIQKENVLNCSWNNLFLLLMRERAIDRLFRFLMHRWFPYVSRLGIKHATLVYWGDTLTHRATGQGLLEQSYEVGAWSSFQSLEFFKKLTEYQMAGLRF